MCLALVAVDAHPGYRIVIVANRDEFHARPAAPAAWWPEGWLAGRDLEGGGTWLGVARTGTWALVTNVREPGRHDAAAPSRGALVPRVLADAGGPATALAVIHAGRAAHNGYNLVGGDRNAAHWTSNRAGPPRTLAPGVHGLSNAALDTPWPKVERGKAALARWCRRGGMDVAPLWKVLADRAVAPDDALPATGVPLEWERALSAPFIVGERYGTRSSTIVTIARDGAVRFVERRFDATGRAAGAEEFRFTLAG
jgi:uncharacterized protein with NRDE domain